MPYRHSSEQIKTDAAAAAQHLCPECLQLVPTGAAVGHVVGHWPRYESIDPTCDAARRARLVIRMDDVAKET